MILNVMQQMNRNGTQSVVECGAEKMQVNANNHHHLYHRFT